MLKVLVIDDSQTIHNFMAKYLGRTRPPVEVLSAMHGQAAVDRLQADPSLRPDLIFLDWEMPVLNGPETFAKLRAMGVKTPVIMLTSKSDVRDIEQMLNAGVDEYVMKPFTADVILEKASNVLRIPVAADGV